MDTNYTDRSICRYFLRGCCRFGSECWNKHETPLCRFFLRGDCYYGQRCRYLHVPAPKDDLTPEICYSSPQIENSEVHQENGARASGAPSEAAAAAATASGQDSSGVTCPICMENINEEGLAEHKTFGILPNCSHVFCEPCIVTWRRIDGYSADVVKGCPVCRVRSDFYVPCEAMVEGEEKERLIVSTRQRCREEFCSFYNESGLCPFEEGCCYLTARRIEHQREEEEGTDDDDSDDDYVEFFTSVVDMGEENLRQFIAEARNNPDTLREFMIRFL